jgi:hypothetical protein
MRAVARAWCDDSLEVLNAGPVTSLHSATVSYMGWAPYQASGMRKRGKQPSVGET